MKSEDQMSAGRTGKHNSARIADSNCGNAAPLFKLPRPGEWNQAKWEKEHRGQFSDPCNPFGKRKTK